MIFLLSLLLTHVHAKEESWLLEKDSDDIQVYTRSVTDSSIREFKAITVIDAPLNVILAVFNDFNAYPDWFHQTSKASLITRINQKERYSYQDIKTPFPLDDRDLIIHSQIVETDQALLLNTKVAPLYCQQKENEICNLINQSNNILVQSLTGQHRFRILDEKKVELIWQQHIELGGSVPSWMVNDSIIDTPFQTFKNLKQQVKLERYQHIKFEDL